MSTPSGQSPERRLRSLEDVYRPPACERCKGQEWRVVIDDAPMPEPVCPTCGQIIRVVHIVTDDAAGAPPI